MMTRICYRSLSQVRSDAGAIEALAQLMTVWLCDLNALDLTEEHLTDFSPGVYELEGGLSLIVLHGVGRQTARRYWRVEGCSIQGVVCDVSVLVSESKGDQYTPETDWLLVRVVTSTEDSERKVPVLVPPFMEQAVRQELCHDIGTGFVARSRAVVAHSYDIPALTDSLLDPARELPWLVGYVPQKSDAETWGRILERVTARCTGIVGTALVDKQSAAALVGKMGPHLRIPPGHLRLFLPRMDGDDFLDAARHRIIPLGPIFDNGEPQDAVAEGEAVMTIASLALDGIAEETLPAAINRVVDEMSGIQGELRARIEHPTRRGKSSSSHRAGATSGLSPGTEDFSSADVGTISGSPTIAHIMSALRGFLGTSKVDAETDFKLQEFIRHYRAEEQIRQKERETHERTRSELDGLRNQSQALIAELKAVEDDARSIRRQLETFRQIVLKSEGCLKSIDYGGPLDESPHTMEDLRVRVAGQGNLHELVSLSLTAAEAGDLDRHDQLGRYPTVFWEYVLVLADYVRARRAGWTSGLKTYLKDPQVAGRKVSADLLVSVMADGPTGGYGARECDVPEHLVPNGRQVMSDLLKSSRRLPGAPVAYFYDDTGGLTGMVHIGHIGLA